MPTHIIIRDALLRCQIGVSDEERAHPQSILLNATCQIERLNTDDAIESTVDYGEVLAAIRALTIAPYLLLETLADDCIATCFRFPHVTQVSIQLEKRHILPVCGSVGVIREASNTEPIVHTVFLALGCNVGDRLALLGMAADQLRKTFGSIVLSPIYETKPVGRLSQPNFYNQVIKIHTSQTPMEVLNVCQNIERLLGRQNRGKWGPREIDIDLLLHGNHLVEEEACIVPHSEMHRRDFVLQPLADLAPSQLHPRLKRSMQQILAHLPNGDRSIIRTIDSLETVTTKRRKTHAS